MSKNLIVSPLLPIPPTGLLTAMSRGYTVHFDSGENYVKQSIRNRYHILSANGVQALTIPVIGQKGEKIPTKNILIDYDEPWIRIHMRALESAYRSSPFFDHYYPQIQELLNRKHENFLDFFRSGMKLWLRLLQWNPDFSIGEEYYEGECVLDLRTPIKSPSDFPAEFHPSSYMQVFEDRFDFQPNLSIVDLLFNEGPSAMSVLKT